MVNPISFLKARFSRPTELTEGSVFAMGEPFGRPADDCLWRVCHVRHFLGIPHVMIEHPATGNTKTVAVSALLRDRTFQFVQPRSA